MATSEDSSPKRILIVGCGSIGERHLRCFQHTQRAELAACDTNPQLLEKITREYNVTGFASLEQALASHNFDAMAICTPAHTHIRIALDALDRGIDLLIEKPLSTSLEKTSELKAKAEQSARFVRIAYVYHVIPAIVQARQFLLQGSLGKPLQVVVSAGQHFPTYRPAYREIYYTRHETGGGAIQDALTHLANAVEWLVGPTTQLACQAAHQMLEGVTVEDTVTVCARSGDVIVSLSLNQFQAPNETLIQVHCEGGSLKIELHEQRWAVFARGADAWEYHLAPIGHRDDLFVAQASAFLDGMQGKACALCTLDEAIQTLKFNMAALESARSGQAVCISSKEKTSVCAP